MESLEALWTVEYETVNGWNNGGVVVLETGRVFGGDSQYFYVGKYSISGSTLNAIIDTTHYFGERSTAFGDMAGTFQVSLVGNLMPDGTIAGMMGRTDAAARLRFRMTRRAPLP